MAKVPTPWVHTALKQFIDAGHGDRIVFGSDYWGTIPVSLDVIKSADFLSEQQRRAILYDNAAQLLKALERSGEKISH